MAKPSDVRVTAAEVFFIPVIFRMPLRFGAQTVNSATSARVRVQVTDRDGNQATGWGETPLAVQWGWPSAASYESRHNAMRRLCVDIAESFIGFPLAGHPIEITHDFRHHALGQIAAGISDPAEFPSGIPELASLICLSCFDLAMHDAFGILRDMDVYRTYTSEFMNRDLADLFESSAPAGVSERIKSFRGRYPADYLNGSVSEKLKAWHLVGGLDPLETEDLIGSEPRDGHPVLLADWIAQDGLECLKIKLRGDDFEWDCRRVERVGRIGLEHGVKHFCADFNCTVQDTGYVHAALDRIARDQPAVFDRVLYIEQPFPYDLAANPIEVRSIAARKRLFLDESAHDWTSVEAGRLLGWNGVALKTCKTLSGALLSLVWARSHGMDLMVQDLTNSMLAAIPHALLAAHAQTIMGVETNAMQFHPEASAPEAVVHPGLYRRRGGCIDLSTLSGPGFGMRVEEIGRKLPKSATAVGGFQTAGKPSASRSKATKGAP